MKTTTIVVAVASLMTVAFVRAQAASTVEGIKQKAESGDAMAQAQYAQMLQSGQGVDKNEAEALKWYQKAAEAGNSYAQANMGVFCQAGSCGMTKDLAKAAEWYEKAAKQGNAYAQCYLARLYENGNGVDKNIKKAAELYGKAAKGGMPTAQFVYALKLSQGEGVDRNVDEALKWAEKAVAAGEGNASKLVDMLKKIKKTEDETPKSLLGIEFGKTVEEVANIDKASRMQDGGAVEGYVDPKKPFRKFTGKNAFGRINLFGSITTHRVFRFKWESEDFSKETQEEEAVSEFKKTCDVIAKKFGGKFHDVIIKDSDKFTIWDRKAFASFGFLKVEMFLEARKMTMTVTNTMLESQAKEEVEALRAAEGDGSDVL
ncbi:MAG: sel1 repeat family protein [Kiritimatiellae bacterium]|nr:sel1 repeat family protein [Kiritimatiellia bacterium]